jgi:hypothetical protein
VDAKTLGRYLLQKGREPHSYPRSSSILYFRGSNCLSDLLQMATYRSRMPEPNTVPSGSTQQGSQATALGWVNLGLPPSAADDDDDDDEDMLWSSLGSGFQSVKQEYRSYAFGSPAGSFTLDSDIIKFWEVRYFVFES